MIRLEQVSKHFGRRVAVDRLDLSVARGEVCALVGPSGCGKTTTLKMINRLIEPTSGRIVIDGTDVTAADPVQLRRGIGYVIQHVGLFPHLTVAANVGTVPRLLGWDRDRVRARVIELLSLVGLDGDFSGRYPHELSGGQRQRVGVARALAADPPVLLMDEPFGAIDPITRTRLQQEFRRLQAELRKTVVFVTHDVEEAVLLGDRIAVFREGGVLEQHDTPAVLLAQPATPFVAEFVGADRGLKRLSVTSIDAALLDKPPTVAAGEDVRIVRDVLLAADSPWAVVLDAGERVRGWLGLEHCTGTGSAGERARPLTADVPVDATLKQAFAVMLQQDAAWVVVVDGDRYVGVLTPDSLHAALRRSVDRAVS